MPIMIKSLLLCAMALVYILLIELSHKPLFECFDGVMGTLVPIDTVSVTVVVLFVVAVALHGRQVEWMTRLDFLWQLQVQWHIFWNVSREMRKNTPNITYRDQSFTCLMTDFNQDINRVTSFSRCLNGTFHFRNCSNKTLVH